MDNTEEFFKICIYLCLKIINLIYTLKLIVVIIILRKTVTKYKFKFHLLRTILVFGMMLLAVGSSSKLIPQDYEGFYENHLLHN